MAWETEGGVRPSASWQATEAITDSTDVNAVKTAANTTDVLYICVTCDPDAANNAYVTVRMSDGSEEFRGHNT